MIENRRAGKLVWKTSTRTGQNNQCVAVAEDGATVLVRDTKNLGDGPFLLFKRDQWAVFLREVVHRLPSANRAVVITAGDLLRVYPKRGEVLTRWHMRSLTSGDVLHFDDGEWEAFRLGAADGEFGPLAPPPAPVLVAS